MSDFDDLLEEYMGDAESIADIRVTVRRLWFYDFDGFPLRIWQGKGRLFTSDDNIWLGSIGPDGRDIHSVPSIQDGRDGSSATYSMSLDIPDLPGQSAFELYEEIKADTTIVAGRNVTCYLAIFKEGELLRPSTPIIFFKELRMFAPKFSEMLEPSADGVLLRKYKVTVTAKDNNFGRSNVPNGTYADTIQKQRAREVGVEYDRGSEFLALLANRTYQIP